MTDADLTVFLRARYDEEERLAHAAAPGPWVYQDIDSVGGGRVCDPDVAIAAVAWDNEHVDPRIRRTIPAEQADGTGEHIAHQNPARVLAKIAADRQIIDVHACDRGACRTCWSATPRSSRREDFPCPTLRAMALPYAGHPDYRPEWRP